VFELARVCLVILHQAITYF